MAGYGQGFLSNLEQYLDPSMKRKTEELKNLIRHIEPLHTNDKVAFNIVVPTWLQECREVLSEISELRIEDKIHKNFPYGMRDHLYQRFNVLLKIHGIRGHVTRLLEEGKTAVKGFKRSSTIEIVGSKAENAYKKILQNVSQVQNNGVIMISGRPGVGKTAVASKIYSHALESASFRQVIWVTGAWDVTLEDMHKEIAFQMNIDLSEDHGDVERAKTLEDALRKNKERWGVLVVIELWKDFPLKVIGIPEPETTDQNGYKLVVVCRTLLAGRSFNNNAAGYQVEDHEIECLSELDAYNLFCSLVGKEDFDSLSEETRRSLLERCDSLPYVIVNAGEGIRKWFHDKRNIEVGRIPSRIYGRIALDSVNFTCDALENSYQSLSEKTRVYFLYCALFPSHWGYCLIEPEDMIRHWICDGLMEGNREAIVTDTTFKHGKEILDEMENAYLVKMVINRNNEGKKICIKMNHSVKEMAAHISRTQYTSHRFFIEVGSGINEQFIGGLSKEAIERASVMSDQLEEFGRQTMNSLSTLVVRNQHDYNHLSLPEHFFKCMPNVKVLDLSSTHIESFPHSFHCLSKLRALHLRRCHNLVCLPDVSCFLELLVLDLSLSRITELPSGFGTLRKLLRLDISGTPMRKFPFPDGLLTMLTGLQELLMMSSYLWTGEENVQDLKRLTKLARLEANFFSLQALRRFVDSSEPEGRCPPKFRFSVGERCLKQSLGENTLAILIEHIPTAAKGSLVSLPSPNALHVMHNKNLDMLPLQYNRNISLRHLTAINVSDCGGLVYLFQPDMFESVPNLSKIVVQRCDNMVALIKEPEGTYSVINLGILKELVCFHLEKLERICNGGIKCESLESISVWECYRLWWMPNVVGREDNNKPIKLKGHKIWLDSLTSISEEMYTKTEEVNAPSEFYSQPTYTDISDQRPPQEKKQSIVTCMKFLIFSILICVCACSIHILIERLHCQSSRIYVILLH